MSNVSFAAIFLYFLIYSSVLYIIQTALEAVDSNHDGHLTPAEYAKMVQSYPQILKMFEIRSFSGFCNALLRQFRDSAASFASPETRWVFSVLACVYVFEFHGSSLFFCPLITVISTCRGLIVCHRLILESFCALVVS